MCAGACVRADFSLRVHTTCQSNLDSALVRTTTGRTDDARPPSGSREFFPQPAGRPANCQAPVKREVGPNIKVLRLREGDARARSLALEWERERGKTCLLSTPPGAIGMLLSRRRRKGKRKFSSHARANARKYFLAANVWPGEQDEKSRYLRRRRPRKFCSVGAADAPRVHPNEARLARSQTHKPASSLVSLLVACVRAPQPPQLESAHYLFAELPRRRRHRSSDKEPLAFVITAAP